MPAAGEDPRHLIRVGVISDTHGHLPDEATDALAGTDAIVHAGDVGTGHILDILGVIAPVTAVRGNCDHSGDAARLPAVANVVIGGVRFLVGHQDDRLTAAIDPIRAGAAVVVTGHTHQPSVRRTRGVLHVNPGSAGDPRRGRPATVAIVEIDGGRAEARIVEL